MTPYNPPDADVEAVNEALRGPGSPDRKHVVRRFLIAAHDSANWRDGEEWATAHETIVRLRRKLDAYRALREAASFLRGGHKARLRALYDALAAVEEADPR